MKVVMIGQKGMPALFGGVEKHVDALSRELSSLGLNVVVYARPHYTAVENIIDGVEVKLLPSISTKHLDAITHTFFATMHAIWHGADVFHYHGVGPALLCFLPRILRPWSKVVVTFHCVDRLHQKWGFFARMILHLGEWGACNFPHETIVVSRGLQQYCFEKYASRTYYVPHGLKAPKAMKSRVKILSQMNLKTGFILSVSRLVRHKGIHYLISAYNDICKTKKRIPDLVIVGDSANTDDYVLELKSLASGNRKVIFTGFKTGDDLRALYDGAKFVVQPSENEGLSLVVLEAMSYARPILVSNIPANLEAVGSYGFTFRSRSVEDLKEKLSYILSLNPNALKKSGESGQKFALEKYSWPQVGSQTMGIYKKDLELSTEMLGEFKI